MTFKWTPDTNGLCFISFLKPYHALFFCKSKGVFRIPSNSNDGDFCENSHRLFAGNYFCGKVPSETLDIALNTPLRWTHKVSRKATLQNKVDKVFVKQTLLNMQIKSLRPCRNLCKARQSAAYSENLLRKDFLCR